MFSLHNVCDFASFQERFRVSKALVCCVISGQRHIPVQKCTELIFTLCQMPKVGHTWEDGFCSVVALMWRMSCLLDEAKLSLLNHFHSQFQAKANFNGE